jgi:4-amino-4-deoxy-L-arabinose transferase-like glycosyltransferase
MSEPRSARSLVSSAWAPRVALLFVGVLVGAWLGADYGMSWDEERNYTVGSDALQSYLSPQRYQDYLSHGDPLAHHGPAYFMLFALVARGLVSLNPAWHIADGRHLTNFLIFLAGLVAFYALALRLTSRRTAWMAAALFATQPLLFGHAFINQKDTPFMAFFLISVAVGMHAVDRLPARQEGQNGVAQESGWRHVRRAWGSASLPGRILLVSYLLAGVQLLAELALPEWRAARLTAAALAAQRQGLWVPLQALADTLASGNVEPAGYLVGLSWLHDLGRLIVVLAWLALAPVVARRTLPEFRRSLDGSAWGWLVLAGALLGLTIAIRQVGAFAGLLILLYWLRRGRAGWWLFGLYLLVAAATCFAAWPYLWAEPFHRFWESLAASAAFEVHMTPYRGEWVFSDQLPWHYFPTLAGLELTLPAVALFLGGLGVATWRWSRKAIDRAAAEVVLTWLLVPLLGLIVFGLSAYNNIRQLHFVLVPMFLLAGIGLDGLMAAVKRRWAQVLLLGLVLLPGIAGIVRLHPYEYTYFNALAGGTSGAEGEYGLDYFCTSYREAMEYVNEVAAPGDQVMVMGPLRPAMAFARADLEVLRNEGDRPVGSADYLVTCYRWLGQAWQEPDLHLVHRVGAGGATFAEVFRRADPAPGGGE